MGGKGTFAYIRYCLQLSVEKYFKNNLLWLWVSNLRPPAYQGFAFTLRLQVRSCVHIFLVIRYLFDARRYQITFNMFLIPILLGRYSLSPHFCLIFSTDFFSCPLIF